ncbi:artemin [Saccopteryx bilineata]|uniref:artemin n=1 Tax=Saccopteryx bilineata TaxID=59482 RepID=UPI00338FC061
MEPGHGGPSVLPCWAPPRRQPALWLTLAALVLLSSVAEASLGLPRGSPATRESPAPAPAPPAGHLPGGRTSSSCSARARRPLLRPASPPPALSPWPAPSRGSRAARVGGRGGQSSRRSPAGAARGCHLHSQVVPVRALGLGLDSDELVNFSFCSGSCRRARSQHDLSLAKLLSAGALELTPGVRPITQPCCRPTGYENIVFMDVDNSLTTVNQVSATACDCLS